MEAVAPDALLVKCAREREAGGGCGAIMVEGGVEAGDLGKVRRERGDRADGSQIMGLVERGQWTELLKLLEHYGIDQARLGEVDPAVDDAVPDGDWLVRVMVDGAQSLPTMSADVYDGPMLSLP